MDTLGNQLRLEGARVNQEINAVSVVILSSGKTFRALASSQPAFDPSMELGSDLREIVRLSVVRSDLSGFGVLDKNALSQVAVTIAGSPHTITKREDNTASPFIDFDVVKVPS
jgi:hypothetical protein